MTPGTHLTRPVTPKSPTPFLIRLHQSHPPEVPT
jgi:hypothetical protein